jgi:hypothetical protein
MGKMANGMAPKENKAQAWYHILKAVQVEATDNGQDFLAYLIGIAMTHLASVRVAGDLDRQDRS